MRELTVSVPGRPPTPNARRHWRSIAKDNAEWKVKAFDAAMSAAIEARWSIRYDPVVVATVNKKPVERNGVLAEPMEYARCNVMIFVPDQRDRDWDNAVASLKPLFDGIRIAGVIRDDSIARIPHRVVEVVYVAHVSKVVFEFTEEPSRQPSLGL